jgi:hypothetical protein
VGRETATGAIPASEDPGDPVAIAFREYEDQWILDARIKSGA